MIRKVLSLCLALIITTSYLTAGSESNLDRYSFSSITQSRVLMLPGVHSLLEDDNGVIWVSTRRGATRYNGQHATNYTLQPWGARGRAARAIRVRKSPGGNILAFDDKGRIYQFSVSQNKFEPLMRLDSIYEDIQLNDIYPDERGRLWMATHRGIGILTPDDSLRWILEGETINALGIMDRHLLGCSAHSGIIVITPEGETALHIGNIDRPRCTYYDPNTGFLWIGTFHQGVKVADMRNGGEIVAMPALNTIPTTPVRVITPLDDQTILIGNDGAGLFAASRNGEDVVPMFADSHKGLSPLHGQGIYDICVDSDHNIWIASYSGGVDIAYPAQHLVETVSHIRNNPNSLINPIVNDIEETPDGKLWYATENGISICDPLTGNWRHALGDAVVLDLTCTAKGQVLAATYGKGVYLVNPNGSSTRLYSTDNGTLQSDYTYRLHAEADGSLWVGCLDGKLAHICNQGIKYYPIQMVQCITPTPDGNLAIGTASGWYRVEEGREPTLQNYGSGKAELAHYNLNITSILFPTPDEVWIGCEGSGLHIVHLNDGTTENITEEQGLPSNAVCSLTLDGIGSVIVTTDQGIAIVNQQSRHVNNVNYLPELERTYMPHSVCTLHDGRFALGSSSGAVIIDNGQLKVASYEAPLRITRLSFPGIAPEAERDWNEHIHQMLNEGNIDLPAAENSLTIHFESICYAYQHDILYQYILEGYDEEWSTSSERQRAQYSRLPSGHYIFHVKCVSRNDGHEISSVSLPINIAQPWWNTWWAWMGYLFVLISFICVSAFYIHERQLRWANKRRINFFLHVAHNIRTPLSLILSPLEHLAQDPNLSDESKQYLETSREGCLQLQSMVSQLLDFNKIHLFSQLSGLKPINVMMMLSGQMHKFESLANQRQITLTLEPVEDMITVKGDLSATVSILENLLSNALKYTPRGGSVTITTKVNDQNVNISITDTGIGIPASEQKQIFIEYYRASNAIASQQEGTGLGLAQSYSLARVQGGNLSFTSQEGRGTTFTLELKRGQNQPFEAAVTQPNANGETESGTTKERDTLLFVDDNEGLRRYIRLTFGNSFQVETVGSAEEALAYLKEYSCDIIVSDVMMPGMHGDQFCRIIKDNPETAWLPVILLTANADRNSVLTGMRCGADDYVLKPFDDTILRTKVEMLLTNRRRLSQYYLEHSIRLANSSEQKEETDEMSSVDKEFIEQATNLVLKNLGNGDYNIDNLCQDIGMSRTSFFGRIKSLTAQSPQQFIRVIRMEHAASLLRKGRSVNEVALDTGFANPKYFSIVFKSYFGVIPSKFE